MELARTRCRYFENDRNCQRGDRCFYQHGSADERSICLECHAHRSPLGKDYCQICYANWRRIQAYSKRRWHYAKESRPVERAKDAQTVCAKCKGPTSLSIRTGQSWCRACQPPPIEQKA